MKIIIMSYIMIYCLGLFDNALAGTNSQDNAQGINQQSINVSNVVLTLAITNTCTAGDAIYVRATLKNQCDKIIFFYRGARVSYDSLHIQVFNSKKEKVPYSNYGENNSRASWRGKRGMNFFCRNGLITLMPGEEISMDIKLSRLFDLTEAGSYFLSVEAAVNEKPVVPPLFFIKVDKMQFKVVNPLHQEIYLIERHLKNYGKSEFEIWKDQEGKIRIKP